MPCPSAQQPVNDGNLDFLPGYTEDFNVIVDHCNGLILYEEDLETAYVVNPATRRWDHISCDDDVLRKAYLVCGVTRINCTDAKFIKLDKFHNASKLIINILWQTQVTQPKYMKKSFQDSN
jgi:hypothetical protein